jgi:hypothetical protein
MTETEEHTDDDRALALRILRAMAEVDPTMSGATLLPKTGGIVHLTVADLRREAAQ